MRTVLNAQNRRLQYGLQNLSIMIALANIPVELEPYRVRVCQFCQQYCILVEENIRDLQLEQDAILEDVLSNTQVATRNATLLSTRWAVPILRSSDADRLS